MIRLLILLLVLCGCASAKPKEKHRSTEKRAHKMALKDNLVAYWGFEYSPQLYPQVFDQSGNGNHLSANNFVVGGSGVVTAKLGNGIETDGSNGFSLSSYAGISHEGDDFTVVMWFKPSTLVFTATLVSGNEWSVVLDTVFKVTIDGKELTLSTALEAGQWYFLAFGWNSGAPGFIWASVNLADGIQDPRSSITQTLGSFLMGNNTVGVFDDMAIYRRSVSDEELEQIYNDGDGLPFEDYEEQSCRSIECCD